MDGFRSMVLGCDGGFRSGCGERRLGWWKSGGIQVDVVSSELIERRLKG